MVWGSDKILDELEEIGEATKPSPLILALIIMGVDLEEFIASLTGAIGGLPELAVRNVIGNNIIFGVLNLIILEIYECR